MTDKLEWTEMLQQLNDVEDQLAEIAMHGEDISSDPEKMKLLNQKYHLDMMINKEENKQVNQ